MKSTFKCSLYLLARLILVCMLSFMSIPLSSQAPDILNPILAVFYLFVLFYFFTFTAWHEGGKDKNLVAIGAVNYMPYKGFAAAAIVSVPFMALCVAMTFFSSVQNIVLTVLRVIEAVFVMSVFYVISVISPTTTAIVDGVETVVSSPDKIPSAAIVCVVFTVAIICSGVGYLVGYKKILIFKPVIDKIMGRK